MNFIIQKKHLLRIYHDTALILENNNEKHRNLDNGRDKPIKKIITTQNDKRHGQSSVKYRGGALNTHPPGSEQRRLPVDVTQIQLENPKLNYQTKR